MKAGLPKINQEQPFSDISRPKMDNIATIIVSELSCEGIPPDNLPEWQRYYVSDQYRPGSPHFI
tara:strand:- start:8 stop:199 length:192 start_codon:yes stop_codon:yes gene_type:complete